MESYYFRFEEDFITAMQCIPMAIRCKLDTCLIKLRLEEWVKFSLEEKKKLFEMPCIEPTEIETYQKYLRGLVLMHTGHFPAELSSDKNDTSWLDLTKVPVHLSEKALLHGAKIDLSMWQALNPLQRFALVKLGKVSHESKNFVPALIEFGLK
jgi:hypothetical protein